jgi:Holliday junction resolvase RusA-like endonuclease
MTGIVFIVRAVPAPQGSKSAFRNQYTGKIQQVESSKKVKPWRDAVRSDAVTAMRKMGVAMFDGPLFARMVFTMVRPKSHYRTGKNAHLLRDDAPARPASAPDLSKLLRSTEDALTDAGLWRDDARVVEYLRAAKVYAGEDPDALDSPGAIIHVWGVGMSDVLL